MLKWLQEQNFLRLTRTGWRFASIEEERAFSDTKEGLSWVYTLKSFNG